MYSLCADISANMFFSGGADNLLIFWRLESELPYKIFTRHKHTIYALCLIKDKNLVVSASGDKTIILWNYVTL